jgi:1,5-anhydro-D-fructose reductase (1,5-anhydro-D-mannitol-forming)
MVGETKQSAIRNPQSAIHYGVVGCGWVARDYVIPAILESNNSRLVALCDLDCGNYEQIEPTDKTIIRTTDLAEFLAAPDLQAVYIATPNNSHRFLTEQAARFGKHVLCEKPMATNYDDAAAMVEVCRENGVQYATAFDQRFQGRHLKLKEIVESGVLGDITVIRIHYACWLPADWAADNWRIDKETAGGGAFIDLAPHGLDLSQFLLGEEIVDFTCFLQRKAFDYAVDDGAVAIGRFAGGALLQMNVAYNCPDNFPRRTLEIIGTKAMAMAVNTMGQTSGGNLYLIDANGERREVLIEKAEDISPFRRQIEVFSDCLLNEKPFPFAPERDLQTMRILTDAV